MVPGQRHRALYGSSAFRTYRIRCQSCYVISALSTLGHIGFRRKNQSEATRSQHENRNPKRYSYQARRSIKPQVPMRRRPRQVRSDSSPLLVIRIRRVKWLHVTRQHPGSEFDSEDTATVSVFRPNKQPSAREPQEQYDPKRGPAYQSHGIHGSHSSDGRGRPSLPVNQTC